MSYTCREFLASWEHVSRMEDSQSIRDDYANFLTADDVPIRKTLDALGVDVGCLLHVLRSEIGQRVFRDQLLGIEGLYSPPIHSQSNCAHFSLMPHLRLLFFRCIDCHSWPLFITSPFAGHSSLELSLRFIRLAILCCF